jgi:hypothetical protein
MIRGCCVLAGALTALALAGCGGDGGKVPPLAEAEVLVLLGGQPLPNAQVTFSPTGAGLAANVQATGVTDDGGRCKLTTGGKPGVALGESVVTVAEAPTPESLRGEDAQEKLAQHRAGLKNRPIPPKYATTGKSDIRVTVTKDQKEYKVELSR